MSKIFLMLIFLILFLYKFSGKNKNYLPDRGINNTPHNDNDDHWSCSQPCWVSYTLYLYSSNSPEKISITPIWT